jgi:ketosteroid isomerase-like protein
LLLPPTHNVTKGRSAIEQFFEALFKAGLTSHTLQLIEAEGDQRGIAAAAKWTAKKKEGVGEEALSGIATHVFERQQGGLALWLHTFN